MPQQVISPLGWRAWVVLRLAMYIFVYYFCNNRGICYTCTTMIIAYKDRARLARLALLMQPALRLLRGFANFYGVSGCKLRYPEGSVGHLLAQGGFRQALRKPRSHFSDLMVLLRAELTVPDLVISYATAAAGNLYTWPSSNFSKDNGHCYRCLLCNCDVCTPAKQWLTHVSGHYGRLIDWHRYSMTDKDLIAIHQKFANIAELPIVLAKEVILMDALHVLHTAQRHHQVFPELQNYWHELTLGVSPWDYLLTITLVLHPCQILFVPDAFSRLRNVTKLEIIMAGCYASDAHLHAYCCVMCQSLGLLLVALQSVRSLKKLKLDFTAFSWAQSSADALMALQCLWRQMEELLVANGNIRLIKLVEPATTAAQTSSLTAAAGRGYLKLKDDLTAGLLFATTSRAVQAKGLKLLPIHLLENIVLKAMPAKPCQIKCIQTASDKT